MTISFQGRPTEKSSPVRGGVCLEEKNYEGTKGLVRNRKPEEYKSNFSLDHNLVPIPDSEGKKYLK